MDVSTGGSDEGPRTLLARVHPVIRRAELRTTGGEIIDVPVEDLDLASLAELAKKAIERKT